MRIKISMLRLKNLLKKISIITLNQEAVMKYKNASHVLPDELLNEIQKYVTGEAIYIPEINEKKKWGEGSGARAFYQERNKKIQFDYQVGMTVNELAEKYGLSIESIKRILYRKMESDS